MGIWYVIIYNSYKGIVWKGGVLVNLIFKGDSINKGG